MENAHAILIGIGGEDFEVTAQDALSIYDVLTDSNIANYSKKNVCLLTNSDASKENILSEFDSLINKVESENNSTVVVYFSGHGIEKENVNQGIKEYFLVPHGADDEKIENTMLSGQEFSKKISQIKANRLLVLLDCCYAAGMKDDSVSLRLKGGKEKVLKGTSRKLLKMLGKGEGRVFMSSCDDDELSAILPTSKNSLFTEVILEALKGEMSGTNEYVHVIDLMAHVIREVPLRISKFNHLQRPIVNEVSDLTPEYFICRNSSIDSKDAILKNIWKNNSSELMKHKLDYIDSYLNDFEEKNNDVKQVINNDGATIKNQVNIGNNSGAINLN